jgi:hypothetical protein
LRLRVPARKVVEPASARTSAMHRACNDNRGRRGLREAVLGDSRRHRSCCYLPGTWGRRRRCRWIRPAFSRASADPPPPRTDRSLGVGDGRRPQAASRLPHSFRQINLRFRGRKAYSTIGVFPWNKYSLRSCFRWHRLHPFQPSTNGSTTDGNPPVIGTGFCMSSEQSFTPPDYSTTLDDPHIRWHQFLTSSTANCDHRAGDPQLRPPPSVGNVAD